MLMIRRRCSDTEVARARLPGGGGQRNAGGQGRLGPRTRMACRGGLRTRWYRIRRTGLCGSPQGAPGSGTTPWRTPSHPWSRRSRRRAREVGYEWLELHFAHGYLGQSFFSTHSNARDDAYGGSLENRCRFLLETLAAVRRVWPEELPLTARFGVIDAHWLERYRVN